jgi:hypothetical protein
MSDVGAPLSSTAQYSPPAWRSKVAEGLRWQVAANAGFLAYEVLYTVPLSGPGAEALFASHVPACLLVASVVVDCVAVWFLTTRDPTVHEPQFPLRQWIRLLTILGAALTIAMFWPIRETAGDRTWVYTLVLHAGAVGTGIALWYVYLSRLVTLAGHDRLAFVWLVVMVVQLACFAALTLYTALSWLTWLSDIYLPVLNMSLPTYVGMAVGAFECYLCWRTRTVFAPPRTGGHAFEVLTTATAAAAAAAEPAPGSTVTPSPESRAAAELPR